MNLSPLPLQKFFDNNGRPLVGGLLFTYVAGTTTKIATYQDQAGTPNTNPIVLNYRGEANVWLDQTLTYKFVLSPEGDTDPPTRPIWSVDNISAGITFASLTQQIIGQLLYPITAAEIAAGVTPVNYAIASEEAVGYVDPRRYGADNTGATNCQTQMGNAIAVLRKTGHHRLYIQGTYKVTTLDLVDSYAKTGGATPPDFNNGLTVFGDGIRLSKIQISPASDGVGNGVDMTGAAWFNFSDLCIESLNGASPKVLLLLAKGFQASAVVFSGNGSFTRCLITGYGAYVVYDQSAEVIDFADTIIQGLGSSSVCFVASRANTAAITSAFAPLNSPGNSMTAVSFTGFESAMICAGPEAVLLDIGTTTGLGHIDLGTTYFSLSGATTAVVKDNGGVGSALSQICAHNIKVEFNGGAGTNQIAVFSAPRQLGISFNGASAYVTGQTAALFVFANGPENSQVTWTPNDALSPASPAVVIQCNAGPSECYFRLPDTASHITFGAAPVATIVAASDGTFSYGTHNFRGTTANGTTFDLIRMPSGGSQGVNRDGFVRRRSTLAVSNSPAVIYDGSIFGELAIVTGLGSGAVFSDLLMIAFNAFAVISSNTQQGAPAARTYSVNNDGTLRLTMGTATAMDIIVQAFRTGAYGA